MPSMVSNSIEISLCTIHFVDDGEGADTVICAKLIVVELQVLFKCKNWCENLI